MVDNNILRHRNTKSWDLLIQLKAPAVSIHQSFQVAVYLSYIVSIKDIVIIIKNPVIYL